jgi:tripartite-type tricarboxylate transporter receptor subunit TctC
MDRRRFTLAAAGAAITGSAPGARAQAVWNPSRPLRIVVSAPPGSTPDAAARPMAELMAQTLGQPVVVENRPGAGGIVGIESVARAAPDGHTLGFATQSQMVFNPHLFARLPYDPVKDLQPIARVASVALLLAAHPSLPANTLPELVALAKSRATPLQIGVPLLGTPPHVDSIAFKSGVDAVAAARSGELPLVMEAPPVIAPHVTAGRLKALAVTGTVREPVLPNVPTIGEALGRSVAGETWFGLVAPQGTPAEAVTRIQRAAAAALARAELRKLFGEFGWRLIENSSPAEFAAVVRDEGPRWGDIIRKAGLKLD